MLTLVTAATTEPVTLDEAKAHLRVIHTGDDALIGALISAAREVVELSAGRALADAGYRWASESCMAAVASLPLWPVASVTAVSYLDTDNVRQTVDVANYLLDLDRSTLTLARPTGSALNVEFTTAPAAIPAALKAAILLMVGDMYENAEANIVAENPTLQRLIFPHRFNIGV